MLNREELKLQMEKRLRSLETSKSVRFFLFLLNRKADMKQREERP